MGPRDTDIPQFAGIWPWEDIDRYGAYARAAVESVFDATPPAGPYQGLSIDMKLIKAAIGFTLRDPNFQEDSARAEERAESLLDAPPEPPPRPEGRFGLGDDYSGRSRQRFVEICVEQIHELLCSQKRSEERASVLSDLRTGSTSAVAALTAFIAQFLGVGVTQMLSAVVAVTLTLIGQIGLHSWCQLYSESKGHRED